MSNLYHEDIYKFDEPVKSYWETTSNANNKYNKLERNIKTNIVVIGGGYTGISCALSLVKNYNEDVVLVEAGHIGWGSSARNAGFCCIYPAKMSVATMFKKFGKEETKKFFKNTIEGSYFTKNLINEYNKIKLVPFGEFVPFRGFIKFMEIIAGSIDFAMGDGQRIVNLNNQLSFIPAICYEIIFFWKLINDENNNADFIINLTNDSWFGQLSGPYQHFYLARLRAAEFNKPLIRVSNNGISAVIDNFGNIIDYIELNKKEIKEI